MNQPITGSIRLSPACHFFSRFVRPAGRGLWFLLLAAAMSFASPTFAQGTNSPPSATPPPSATELPQDLLKSLQEFRKLQNEVPDLNLPSASAVPGEDPYQQRLRSIQQRMELIRSLVQQKQAAEEQARLKSSQPTASPGSQPADASSHTTQGGTAHHGAAHPTDAAHAAPEGATPPAFPMPNLNTSPESMQPVTNASQAPKFVGETVVPSAVDPLELANSLFQTGNYDLALKTYLAVSDKLEKPQDVIWTDYFIASCQRILGDLPAAEKGYRSLVESRRPTRPVEAARWWLDNVERRKSIAATLNDLDASLKAVSEELNANGTKK